MKKVIYVYIVFVLFVIILVCQSFALLHSHTGMAYFFNNNITCTYTINERKNLAQVFSSNPRMKERVKKSSMSLLEKRKCFTYPEEYELVYFDLKIDNPTDFWIMIQPRFKDLENVWFMRKSFMQDEKGTPVKSNPNDSSEWDFGMIVKAGTTVNDIDQGCFKSLARAKIIGGPFVASFHPKTVLRVS